MKQGIPRNARICEVFVDGVWRIRSCRDQRIHVLMQEVHGFPISLSAGVKDGVLWKQWPDDYGDMFVSTETWQQVRQKKRKIQWTKLIWFSQGVPRFAFITWLVFRDRLATGHRTQNGVSRKVAHSVANRMRLVTIFSLPVRTLLHIWLQVVRSLLGAEPDPDWETTSLQFLTRTYCRLTFILLRLVLQVSIYFIWRERNDRKHNSITKPVDQLVRLIEKTVKNRIMSTKYYMKPKLHGLMARWFEAHMS